MSVATRSDPLASNVLVLNRLYAAVHVVGVRRAFGLLYRDLAEVVHVEEGVFSNHDFQSWLEISELRGYPRSFLGVSVGFMRRLGSGTWVGVLATICGASSGCC
jgi:hypothetical protein